ncbi:MAG: c-type cytochrome [Pseudomonadota bacterium]|nr:c-type cytochrome [Pseudomonadota bacterium]
MDRIKGWVIAAACAAAAGLAVPALASDATAGAGVYRDFCTSCHGAAKQNFDNVLAGANNPTAIQIQMQRPGSAMGYLQDVLTSDDIANVAAYLGTIGGAAPAKIAIVEYYHAGFDHYFMTGIAAEISNLDSGKTPGWVRTGKQFVAYASAGTGTFPVCRFFSTAFAPKSSHFYTPSASECATVKANLNWTFEGQVFDTLTPTGAGLCPSGTLPVYRLYNNGQGAAPNHRYTTDLAIRSQMIGKGWGPEGYGPLGVIMCSV